MRTKEIPFLDNRGHFGREEVGAAGSCTIETKPQRHGYPFPLGFDIMPAFLQDVVAAHRCSLERIDFFRNSFFSADSCALLGVRRTQRKIEPLSIKEAEGALGAELDTCIVAATMRHTDTQ
jgi:hypothetical protein